MEPPDQSFADGFNVSQEYAVLVLDVRRAAVSLPFQVNRLEMLVDAGLVAFLSACFEFEDKVEEETQQGSLANLPKIGFSHLHGPSKVAIVGFCAQATPRLLSLLLCCDHLSLHTGSRAPTLCSAWALRAW